ncbi:MAG TPA: WbqC family protein, partial [Vicinamibacterales bacterium]
MPRVVAIHQPNFLPWLGFFDKMDRGDVFVLLDRVQLIRRSYTTRTTVLQGGQPVVLSLPVRHIGTQDLPIGDALLDDGVRATRKAAATIRHAYSRYPFWSDVGTPIVALLEQPPDHLLDLNAELLQHLARVLGIPWTKVTRQSELPHTGKKSELMASLTRAVDGDVYLSGGHDPAGHPATSAAGTGAEYNDERV